MTEGQCRAVVRLLAMKFARYLEERGENIGCKRCPFDAFKLDKCQNSCYEGICEWAFHLDNIDHA